MLCNKCGKEISEESVFCEFCGEKLGQDTSNQQTTNEQQSSDNSVNEQISTQQQEINGQSVNNDLSAQISQQNEQESVRFCTSCGSKLFEDEVFCSICGKRYDEDVKEEVKSPVKMKNGGFKRIAILVAVALVCIATAVKAYPYAKNSVVKLFTSPEEYFKRTVENQFEDVADNVAVSMKTVKACFEETSTEGTLKLETGEKFNKFLNDIEDISGDFDKEYIDWFKNATIKTTTNQTKDKVQMGLDFTLNEQEIGSLDTIVDFKKEEFYIGVPKHNEKYLVGSFDAIGTNYANGYERKEAYEIVEDLIEALPDEKLAEEITLKYIENVSESISETSEIEEGKEELVVDGIRQKVTVLSAELNDKDFIEISENFLKELKDDKDVKKIISEFCSAVDEDEDEFYEGIDYLLEELKEYDGFEFEAEFKLYVNGKGEITGFEFDSDYFNFTSCIVQKGKKFAVEMEFDTTYGVNCELRGSGKMTANKFSGDFVIEAMGNSILNINVKEMDKEINKNGVLSGEVTISLEDDMIKLMRRNLGSDVASLAEKLQVTIKTDAKSINDNDTQVCLIYDGESCVELNSTVKSKKVKDIENPKGAIDPEDEDEAEEWIDDFDFDGLLDTLEKANLPDEALDALEEEIDYLK